MSALHRAVDAMMAKLVPRIRPITVPAGSIHIAKPGVAIPSHSLSMSHVYYAPPPGPVGAELRRDLGRPALAAALRELAVLASPSASFELRAIAEELDTRCPDCHRHLTRDPWRHCATCESPMPTTSGVNP